MGTLSGLRVLFVEDEGAVGFLVESMLEELGCTVACAARVGAALELAGAERFDFALLDVNVAGEPVFPVSAALAARGVPFLFTTGYGADGLPPEFRGHPVIGKPFRLAELEQAMSEALNGAARAPQSA